MSYILLVERDLNLAEMYKTIFLASGFKVKHFRTYQELYKNLDGEGFTAIFLDNVTNGRTLDFISKVRKVTTRQIPIFVVLNEETNKDLYEVFGNVICLPKFPNPANALIQHTKALSKRSQFRDLLDEKKFN